MHKLIITHWGWWRKPRGGLVKNLFSCFLKIANEDDNLRDGGRLFQRDGPRMSDYQMKRWKKFWKILGKSWVKCMYLYMKTQVWYLFTS